MKHSLPILTKCPIVEFKPKKVKSPILQFHPNEEPKIIQQLLPITL